MANSMQGLRIKPSYGQLTGVAVSDELEHIKFPNRNAKFLREGFVMSQLDGEGARVMEEQQQRHNKEVYMDSALISLAGGRGSDSVSNFSFKSAHTQNTQTERTNAMITESVNARKVEYYDLFGTDMEPPLEIDSPSSDEQNYRRNHIHIVYYFNSVRDLNNESMLKGIGAERRMQEITENNTMMLKELYKNHGEHEMQNVQQQQVINDLLPQMQTPVSIQKPKPLFPQDPILQQHLRAVEMPQQSRQPPASGSSNDPESSHEPKGFVGRPRNNHGVPTETRKSFLLAITTNRIH